jgi:hypothetical protein
LEAPPFDPLDCRAVAPLAFDAELRLPDDADELRRFDPLALLGFARELDALAPELDVFAREFDVFAREFDVFAREFDVFAREFEDFPPELDDFDALALAPFELREELLRLLLEERVFAWAIDPP